MINNAKMEITSLQNKLTDMQFNNHQLQKKNDELISLYQEKCKKHTQMTNLYNLLKSRTMRSQVQNAATDSVSQTLKCPPHTSNARPGRSLIPQTATAASRHFNDLSSSTKIPGSKNDRGRFFSKPTKWRRKLEKQRPKIDSRQYGNASVTAPILRRPKRTAKRISSSNPPSCCTTSSICPRKRGADR